MSSELNNQNSGSKDAEDELLMPAPSSVVVALNTAAGKKRKFAKKILDEDTYTKDLEGIIQRDFFPDLKKLKAQKEYWDALESNDFSRLRSVIHKYRAMGGTPVREKTPALFDTPTTFDTPDVRDPSFTPVYSASEGGSDEPGGVVVTPDPGHVTPACSLDEYLSRFTSEDNASFESLMDSADQRKRVKYKWLLKEEEESAGRLAVVSADPNTTEGQLAIEAAKSYSTNPWAYKARNSLMYVPEGVEHTANEKIHTPLLRCEIQHDNTRLSNNPFNECLDSERLSLAAEENRKIQKGKIGPDGKELIREMSPAVGGYGFVGTPSPAPGREIGDQSPMMTWGEIEGTPFRLDGGDIPVNQSPGPQFTIPEPSKREKLALSLAERTSKGYREKKEAALNRVRSSFTTPSPTFGMCSSTQRLHAMSPAAQKLLSNKLSIKHTDKALRASYTPSPRRRPATQTTPTLSSSASYINTPSPISRSSRRSQALPSPVKK